MKKIMWLALTIALLLSACGGNVTDVTDQIANVAQADDPHIASVKNGHSLSYPNQTYGEAFDNFFASPTWKYFVGTKESPDEDGDGEPDGAEENVDIVEFTGYCTYADVKVKALIQFTLDTESDTFQATYLSFNDVPQNMLMLYGLLSAVFGQDEATDGEIVSDETFPTQNPDEESLPDTALEEYTAEAQELALSETGLNLSDFVGEWEEVDSHYPVMEIAHLSGEQCQITITHKYAKWDATGEYDATRGVIRYFDGTYSSLNRASMEWEAEEEADCSGWIYYEAPDALCWYNTADDYAEYFIRTDSLMDEITLNEISYREAIADGWGETWATVCQNMGSDTSVYFEEAESDSSLYGTGENPWDDITIDGVTYEMALKHGWGDAWMSFAEHTGTGG